MVRDKLFCFGKGMEARYFGHPSIAFRSIMSRQKALSVSIRAAVLMGPTEGIPYFKGIHNACFERSFGTDKCMISPVLPGKRDDTGHIGLFCEKNFPAIL